jgi:Holliday junction resolvase RusA-like endonuclease
MYKVKIKPLSVNEAFRGRRFKTPKYQDYEQELMYILPKIKVGNTKLHLKLIFGLSNKLADIDNPVKNFVDCLQKRYQFNDKQIYKLEVEKIDVKKSEEYIEFEISEIN